MNQEELIKEVEKQHTEIEVKSLLEEFMDKLGISDHPNPVKFIVKFPSNYEASIIRNKWSYGGNEGLLELAVVKFDENSMNYDLVYDTSITNDVLGHLTEEEVLETLKEIEKLRVME